MYKICSLVAVLVHVCIAFTIQSIVDEIQRLYLQQGIPFRDNKFLGNLPILEEYDFIIVGSGPTGSAIANRLSEIPQWKVLLLEEGPEGNIYADIPFINEYISLGYFTTPYEVERDGQSCLGYVDGRCHWPGGRGLGGATLHNALIYARGHPSDFDNWALEGNPGWSFEEILPYFLKFENMSIPNLADNKYHSTSGPVHIQYSYTSDFSRMFLEAGQELGYDLVDYNNPDTMIGFSQTQRFIRGVKRESAASAYLVPVKSRPNLHIVKNAFVTKILIDSETRRALGVQFLRNNKQRDVRARNEVIVSAGAFETPKLLMLSGIGPADHLEELGISVIADLPVGYNLQEHLTGLVTFLFNTSGSYILPNLLRTAKSDFLQWANGETRLYSSNVIETIGFVQTKYAVDNRPDIELINAPITAGSDGGALWRRARNVSIEVVNATFGPIYFAEGFSIGPMLMYPRSKGTVRLRSSNPKEPVLINANFLSDSQDIAVLIEGIRISIKLIETTKTFQKVGGRLYTRPVKGCEDIEFNSDEYWECVIRTLTIQIRHQCCTARMGPDPVSSVVDQSLRVHGLAGLRVADASIMPTIVGSHMTAPCYMIGEKAADMIKRDWGLIQ